MFMNQPRKLLLIILISLLGGPKIFCQSDFIYFEHITTEQGLSQNDVNCIFQDRKGFMWFGTNDGLNRYDGYSFELFKPEMGNPNSISSNLIQTLDEDHGGRIWIGTAGGGLNCYDPVTKKFYYFKETSDSTHLAIYEHVLDLMVDKEGILWMSSLAGVQAFEITEKETETGIIPQLQSITLPEDLQKGNFPEICQDNDNNIWIGGDPGLFKVSKSNDTSHPYKVKKVAFASQIPNLQIFSIAKYLKHALLVGTNKGFFYLPDLRASKQDLTTTTRLASGAFGRIQIDKNEQIWVGTPNGLVLFRIPEGDTIPQLIRRHRNDLNGPNSISKNVILSIYEDDFGLLWAGTNGGGVNKFDPEKNTFLHIKKSLTSGSISYDKIRSIYEDSYSNLWVGTEGGGLNFQAAKYNDGYYSHFETLNIPENVFAITEVNQDNQSYLYLGAKANPGLYRIKIRGNKGFDKPEEINLTPAISASSFSLLNDENKFLWVGTYNLGLYRLPFSDIKNQDKRIHFRHDPASPQSLSDDIVRSLLKDSKGNIWIGTGKGLNKISADEIHGDLPQFKRYLSSQKDSLSISHNYILALYESKAGELWVGTFGGGLNKLIPGKNGQKDHFIRYAEKDGLPNDVVKGILEDDLGHLWLATNKGLSRFDPVNQVFKNYDTHDGLQSKEFSELACFRRKNGEMLFGGVNGFNSFFPDSIRDNTQAPEVVFTDFEVVNKPITVGEELNGRVILDKAISEIEHIDLKYDENSFSLAFSALHFSAPEKNHFLFKLEGFDPDWISVTAQKRFATYTNLEPGDYTISVIASNNDGIWNENPAKISITIAPPYWKTWYAYMLYGVLLLGFLIAVQLYTIIGIKDKHALVLEHLENEKTQELNQLKLQFFTNISHELRTPLTLISGPMDYLIKSGKGLDYHEREYQYQLIKKNSNYLLRLVNQLLEFRKMDRGKIQLQVQEGEIETFIREISEPFQFIAQKKQISYEIQAEAMNKQVWFDPGIIEKILYNLLSNAFKFTPKGGSVKVFLSGNSAAEARSKKEGTFDRLTIQIIDTGPGIDTKNQTKIFERFYKGKQKDEFNKGGTGIGLAYTKSLVELHKGSIQLNSTVGQGSTFLVSLPVRKKDYEKSEIRDSRLKVSQVANDPLTYLTDTILEEDPREIQVETSNLFKSGLPYLLIIDDNKDIRRFIQTAFSASYNIVEAENGAEGLTLANEIIPDLIICDVVMPIMDGIEFCETLKTEAKTSHIPVILLTANSSEEVEIEGLKLGADAYIRKPFNLEKLKLRMQNIIKQRLELKDRFRKQILLEPEEVTVTSTDEIFIKKAMDLVEEHMADPEFNVENMVQEIGMSRSKLYLKLKAITGQSSSEFIRTVRLKRAVQLLESSDLTVKEIMYMTGFNTASYFSKCFKKQFGIPPSEYVANLRVKKENIV